MSYAASASSEGSSKRVGWLATRGWWRQGFRVDIIPEPPPCSSCFGPLGSVGSGGGAFFAQRALAASFAMRVRSSAVIFVKRALPPRLPIAAANSESEFSGFVAMRSTSTIMLSVLQANSVTLCGKPWRRRFADGSKIITTRTNFLPVRSCYRLNFATSSEFISKRCRFVVTPYKNLSP
jgi:hypothetical protein